MDTEMNYQVFFAQDISKEMDVETFYGSDIDMPLDVLADIDPDDSSTVIEDDEILNDE